jgi:hypothetical protein
MPCENGKVEFEKERKKEGVKKEVKKNEKIIKRKKR